MPKKKQNIRRKTKKGKKTVRGQAYRNPPPGIATKLTRRTRVRRKGKGKKGGKIPL